MAGRRRKNTVAGSKKESPKTQNTLQETNVSTDKEATKADVKKQAEDVNEKKTADAKIVEIRKCRQKQKRRCYSKESNYSYREKDNRIKADSFKD